jgi:hypothetical protein
MRKITFRMGAIALAGAALLLALPGEEAQAKSKKGAFVGGLVAGALLGGAAAAIAQPPPRYYYGYQPYPPPAPPPGYAFPPTCGYYPYLPCAPRYY